MTVFDLAAVIFWLMVGLALAIIPTCMALALQGIFGGFKDTGRIKEIEEKQLRTNALLEEIRANQRGQASSVQLEEEEPQPRQAPPLPKNPFAPSTVDYGDATGGRSNPLGQFESGGSQNRPPPA